MSSLFPEAWDFAQQRRQTLMGNGFYSAWIALVGMFCLCLLIMGFLYIPMVFFPSQSFQTLMGLNAPQSQQMIWVLVWSQLSVLLLFWQSLLSACLTRKLLGQGFIRGIPFFKLMAMSVLSALPMTLIAFVLRPAEVTVLHQVLTAIAFVVLQSLQANVILLKTPELVLEHGKLFSFKIFSDLKHNEQLSIPRWLFVYQAALNSLGMVSLFLISAVISGHSSQILFFAGFAVIGILSTIGISLFSAILSVKAYQMIRPQILNTPIQNEIGRNHWFTFMGFALLGALSYSLLYTYQSQEMTALKASWQENSSKRLARIPFRRDVLRGRALSGNGGKRYLAIIGKDKQGKSRFVMKDADSKVLANYFKSLEQGKRIQYPTLPLQLKGIESKYLNITTALRLAGQYQNIDFNPKFQVDEPLPDFIQAQHLGRLLSLSALADCQQNRCLEGTRKLLDTLRFAQDLGSQGWLISSMVAANIQNHAIHIFASQFKSNMLNAEEYQIILDEFETLLKSKPGFLKTLIYENELMIQTALDFSQYQSSNFNLLSIGDQQIKSPVELFNWLQHIHVLPQMRQAYHLLQEQEQALLAMESRPLHEIKQRLQARNEFEKALESNWFTSMMAIQPIQVIDRLGIAEAKLVGFYQYIALMAHQQKNKLYPGDLNLLVPDSLAALPDDPFTGQNFMYRRTGNSFRLYSVGPDAKDNQGQGVFFHTNCPQDDLVFAPNAPTKHCQYP